MSYEVPIGPDSTDTDSLDADSLWLANSLSVGTVLPDTMPLEQPKAQPVTPGQLVFIGVVLVAVFAALVAALLRTAGDWWHEGVRR